MAVLVLYATVEGQTEKIARHIAGILEAEGLKVELTAAGQTGFCDPATHDAAILCGPIHMGSYPSALVDYIANWKASLQSVPDALVTVSLAIASDNAEERAEAEAYPRKLTERTGWKPDEQFHVAGALKYTEYDFFRRWIMRRIAAQEGGPVDVSKDHELTDWDAVDSFARAFAGRVKAFADA